MSKKTIIQPVEKTNEMEEIPPPPPAKSFGIHEFKHDGFVNSVSFSNDGRLLATGDMGAKMKAEMKESNAKMNEMKAEMNEMKAEMNGMKSGMNEMKVNMEKILEAVLKK
jgi:hypothetical protein